MAASHTARFPLGVSLHTLDREQRLDTIRLLTRAAQRSAASQSSRGSSVKCLELWEPTFAKDDDNVQQARQALAEASVEPRTVHAAFGASLDISSLDPVIRSAGMEAAGVALDLAVRMGAGIVVVHPSSEPIDDASRPARMEQAKRSIAALAARAREAGDGRRPSKSRRLAIELLPRTCLGRSAEELLALLEGVDPEAAGACLDTNHLMDKFASLPDVVRSLGPRLIALHCSDYDGVDEKHWPPLRGVIGWFAFLAALSDIGFPGPFHYEAGLEGETPAEKLAFLEANFAQVMGGDAS